AGERARLADRETRLTRAPDLLARRGEEARLRLADLSERLARSGAASLRDPRRRLEETWRLLAGLGPQAVLARGYAIVRGPGGVVTSAKGVGAGDALRIEFADGEAAAVGAGKPAKPAKPPPRAKGGQGLLDL
ncbi:MAG: exodeoxyribonuclease VII large subunit, partial [Pikeienuella sp.]